MVNGQTHPPGNAPLKDKREQRHPPPIPSNVSVEAIKRSLVHTPSPRRFKKLRLRRMQERLKREGRRQQVHVAGGGLEQLGNGRRDNQGGHDGDGGIGMQ